MAISRIETLMQLGLLGKANFKAARFLTTWEKLQQTGGIAKDSQECLFSWGILLKKTKCYPF